MNPPRRKQKQNEPEAPKNSVKNFKTLREPVIKKSIKKTRERERGGRPCGLSAFNLTDYNKVSRNWETSKKGIIKNKDKKSKL